MGAAQGMASKATVPITRHFEKKHPQHAVDMRMWNGGTRSERTDNLAKDTDVIESLDVTVVICNVKKKGDKKGRLGLPAR